MGEENDYIMLDIHTSYLASITRICRKNDRDLDESVKRDDAPLWGGKFNGVTES